MGIVVSLVSEEIRPRASASALGGGLRLASSGGLNRRSQSGCRIYQGLFRSGDPADGYFLGAAVLMVGEESRPSDDAHPLGTGSALVITGSWGHTDDTRMGIE